MASESRISQQTFVNVNPATGAVISEHPIATTDEVIAAVEHARLAQRSWAAQPLARRVEVIRRFASLLVRRKQEVAQSITREAGKPIVEALLTEVVVVLDAARFCAENAHRVFRGEEVPHGNPVMRTKAGRLIPEPIGVIGIISPWNYPFSIPATETLAALVCGNAVVLKPSEMTPDSALMLRDLLYEAGVPKEVFQVVLGEGSTGAALLSSAIEKIIFTGSVATGRRVGLTAAQKLIPAVLELGGKDAMIVLDDADVDVASSAAVWGAMMNAGQTCISVERCFVHRRVFDRFVQRCADKISKLRVGNGSDPNSEVGPMVSRRQLEIVAAQVDEARSQGAHVICGGHPLPELGPNFYAPTLITGVASTCSLLQEETFGPVLPVIPVDSEDEAVARTNESEFGLAASIWTTNRARGEAVARRIHAGAVMVNDLLTQFAISEAPHGGVKASGIGRTHGMLGMREMVRMKYVGVERLPKMKKLWWYGYSSEFLSQMYAFVDMLFEKSAGKRLVGGVRSSAALWRKRF